MRIDTLVQDGPDIGDVSWNDVEHDERCCMNGMFNAPHHACPGVRELFRIELSDPSDD